MAADKPVTNRDIPGDTTPQPQYMALKPAEKDLVDRAVYATVIKGAGEFSDEMLAYSKARSFQIPGLSGPANAAPRPKTDQVEQHIEALRERFAGQLHGADKTAHNALQQVAQQAPDAGTSRRTLNAIIQLNGDECGCSGGVAITSTTLAGIQQASRRGQAR